MYSVVSFMKLPFSKILIGFCLVGVSLASAQEDDSCYPGTACSAGDLVLRNLKTQTTRSLSVLDSAGLSLVAQENGPVLLSVKGKGYNKKMEKAVDLLRLVFSSRRRRLLSVRRSFLSQQHILEVPMSPLMALQSRLGMVRPRIIIPLRIFHLLISIRMSLPWSSQMWMQHLPASCSFLC
jgi:hypothetical protein